MHFLVTETEHNCSFQEMSFGTSGSCISRGSINVHMFLTYEYQQARGNTILTPDSKHGPASIPINHLPSGKQRGVQDIMNSVWLTSEGSIVGSQKSVLNSWSHSSGKAQLGHHVTEGWLGSSQQFCYLLGLKGTGIPDIFTTWITENKLGMMNKEEKRRSNQSLGWGLGR